MTALTDLSDIINRLTGGSSGAPEHIFTFLDNRVGAAAATAPIAARWSSLWMYNRTGPMGQGSAPGAGAVPTRATVGALAQANPAGGKQKWLLGAELVGNVISSYLVYDRLWHISGLNGTITTPQTASGTVNRYNTASTCIGNQIWIEIYTIIGATATTVTVSYQNENNATKTSVATAIGATGLREVTRMIPIPLAVGDKGVLGVNSVTLLATTAIAGDFGVTIGRPIVPLSIIAAGCGMSKDLVGGIPSIAEVMTDACLTVLLIANTTTIPQTFWGFQFIEK